ncbi:MAG: hypothetical protein K2P35_07585 [Lachnospiraceae bacterium]|nr:hypothetical protein [Lachnospiraceae bacterium]
MKVDMDELLKKSLTPTDVPPGRLNCQVLLRAKERKYMKHRKRFSAAIVAAACVMLLGSVTVVAARRYFSPAEIASEVQNDALAKAFSGEGAVLVNETQESGGYRITLLGSVAGKNISDYMITDDKGVVEENKIYTVVAIERADGVPMPDTSSDEYDKEPLYVSHYIHGLDPKKYSLQSMGGGHSTVVRDGVMYRMVEMDNIEMFADKGIYVGVSSGTFYDAEAYRFDESSGEISPNTDYEGVNALFILPVDKRKADSAAAEAYLEALHTEWETPAQGSYEFQIGKRDATDLAVEDFMSMLTSENLDEYAVPVESTRKVLTQDQEGAVSYAYELETGASGSGKFWITPEMAVGEYQIGAYSYSDLQSLLIDVFVINEDGTVTYVVYQPKKETQE